MKLQDIPRVKVGCSVETEKDSLSETENSRLELGRKAQQLLGYRGLMSAILGSVEVPLEQIGNLGKALLALEIEVLDFTRAMTYQQEECHRLNLEYVKELLNAGKIRDYFRGWDWTPAKWECTAIKEYPHPIPEFVLEKAVQIAEKAPQTEFLIQHLNQPKADPFLVAKLGDEAYLIEAWDEPRFEGRASR